jgi:hypothetical protein
MRMPQTLSLVIGSTVALLAVPCLRADPHQEAADAPQRMVIHTDHVVPTMLEAYEEKAKAWVAAFKEAGITGQEWSWSTSSSNDFVYVTAFPFSAMADLDRQAERQAAVKEALGEEAFARLNESSGSVARHTSQIARLRPDLSYQPAQPIAGDAPRFMWVAIHTVKPGMEQRFEAVMKQVAATYAKAEHGLGFEIFQIEYGTGSYLMTVAARDVAQFYGGPSMGETMARGGGPAHTQALFAEWRECITDYATSDWTIRADLSYDATAPAAPPPE